MMSSQRICFNVRSNGKQGDDFTNLDLPSSSKIKCPKSRFSMESARPATSSDEAGTEAVDRGNGLTGREDAAFLLSFIGAIFVLLLSMATAAT